MKIPRNILQPLILCLLAAVLLIPAFYSNYYRTCPTKIFSDAGRRSENLILGRLVYSRDNGMFSFGGIPGRCDPVEKKFIIEPYGYAQYQYSAYLENLPYANFIPHRSQLGFQAQYLSLIDKIPWISNALKLKSFYLFNTLLFITVLCLIIAWTFRNFGLFTSVVLIISLLFSLWIVAFGRNLWFVMWAFYLPFASVILVLEKEVQKGKEMGPLLYTTACITVLLKLLFTSYEFVTSALLMVFIPLVYYWYMYRWPWNKLIIRAVKLGSACVVALLISMVILSFQIKSIDGSFSDGIKYIVYSFNRRTLGDPDKVVSDLSKMPNAGESEKIREMYRKSLKSSTFEVIGIYLKKDFLDLRPWTGRTTMNFLKIRLSYLDLILIFIMLSSMGEALCRFGDLENLARMRLRALNLSFWVSFTGPLSWFIIFKGHSFIHNSLDMLVWHMPMVIIGFLLIGLVLSEISRRFFSARKPQGDIKDSPRPG